MNIEARAPEGMLCAQCHNPEVPLTEAKSVTFFYWYARDPEGREITVANVHKECADAWIDAHGGTVAIARDDRRNVVG